jgi:carboxyl-terminal processing protease
VRRPGNARMMQFVLTPQELQSPPVERAFLVQPGIAYLRVSSFDAQTGEQVKAAIEKLGGASLKGLILDLRNNPGGFMNAALDTASLFLKPGATILTVKGRIVQGKEEKVPEEAKPYQFPVAVLINGKSASASEIVAGALQDHDRGVVIGEPSFGKGLVESVYPLPQSTGLALTTAYYYTPSGRSIQRPLQGAQIQPGSFTDGAANWFHTDAGKPLKGGGGIQPDEVVFPEAMSRLKAVLDASGSFTSFATEYLQKHSPVPEGFDITPRLLDEFQAYLSGRDITPTIADWSHDREWIRNRLKTEIVNQALGVEKGDEVEAQRDPVILAALRRMQK